MSDADPTTRPWPVPFPGSGHQAHAENASIAAFNATWGDRFAALRRHMDPAWRSFSWSISLDLRGQAETHFPIVSYFRDLARVGATILPHTSWIPQILRLRQIHLAPRTQAWAPASILDLWRLLPPGLQARPGIDPAAPHVLFCALADLTRCGTGTARYNTQLDRIHEIARRAAHPLRILDLGCGVGHGTWEIAQSLQQQNLPPAQVVGITREPLEAWMATRRWLPHAPERSRELHRMNPNLPVQFLAGNARDIPLAGAFDLIVCNGLVGGDWFHNTDQYQALLRDCRAGLINNGSLMLANRFHDGKQRRVEAFVALAQRQGWRRQGATNDLVLILQQNNIIPCNSNDWSRV